MAKILRHKGCLKGLDPRNLGVNLGVLELLNAKQGGRWRDDVVGLVAYSRGLGQEMLRW